MSSGVITGRAPGPSGQSAVAEWKKMYNNILICWVLEKALKMAVAEESEFRRSSREE
jgi:hypothetical protein